MALRVFADRVEHSEYKPPLRGFALLLLVLVGLSTASAVIVTVPPGLNPGDTYRLVFVTDAMTDATSYDIAAYNTFVTSQANTAPELVALATSWTIIGSTSGIHAILNTQTSSTGVPIFGLNGTKVVDNYVDLWDGTLDSGIYYSQSGVPLINEDVWTGTNVAGYEADTGGRVFATPHPRVGRTGATDFTWVIYTGYDPGAGPADETPHRAYGLSGTLVVTPEPGSAVLFATGFLALVLSRRRKKLVFSHRA